MYSCSILPSKTSWVPMININGMQMLRIKLERKAPFFSSYPDLNSVARKGKDADSSIGEFFRNRKK